MDTITRNHRTDYERWYRTNEARTRWTCTNCGVELVDSDWGMVTADEAGLGSAANYCVDGSRQRHTAQHRGVIEADVSGALARWDAIHRYIVEGIADGSIIADEDPGAAASRLARQGWTPPTR